MIEQQSFNNRIENTLQNIRRRRDIASQETIEVLQPLLRLPSKNIEGAVKQIVAETTDLIADPMARDVATRYFLRGESAVTIGVTIDASESTVRRKIAEAKSAIANLLWYRTQPAREPDESQAAQTELLKVLAMKEYRLTQREAEIAVMYAGPNISNWLSSRQIAEKLVLTRATVKIHLKHIYRKMNAHGKIEVAQKLTELVKVQTEHL